VSGQLNRARRVNTAHVGHHLALAGGHQEHLFGQVLALFDAEQEALPGRAADHQPLYAAGKEKLDQSDQSAVIDAALFVKGRHNGANDAAEIIRQSHLVNLPQK